MNYNPLYRADLGPINAQDTGTPKPEDCDPKENRLLTAVKKIVRYFVDKKQNWTQNNGH